MSTGRYEERATRENHLKSRGSSRLLEDEEDVSVPMKSPNRGERSAESPGFYEAY